MLYDMLYDMLYVHVDHALCYNLADSEKLYNNVV